MPRETRLGLERGQYLRPPSLLDPIPYPAFSRIAEEAKLTESAGPAKVVRSSSRRLLLEPPAESIEEHFPGH